MKTKLIIACIGALLIGGCSDSSKTDARQKSDLTKSVTEQTMPKEQQPQIQFGQDKDKPASTNPSPSEQKEPLSQLSSSTLDENLANQMAKLYGQKCSSCHGAYGEKAALGKSKIIADLSSEQIKTALHGYKNGTFGGDYKANMIAVLKTLNDEQIDNLAAFVADIK